MTDRLASGPTPEAVAEAATSPIVIDNIDQFPTPEDSINPNTQGKRRGSKLKVIVGTLAFTVASATTAACAPAIARINNTPTDVPTPIPGLCQVNPAEGFQGGAAPAALKVNGADQPTPTPRECDPSGVEATFENPHLWSDIEKAMNMTPAQLKALQVKVELPNGKPTTPEDIIAGDDEDTLHQYQGVLVGASVIEDNGVPTDKGVIAIAFSNDGKTVEVGYIVLDLSQKARIGTPLEPQTYNPFTLNQDSRGANTTQGFQLPAKDLIEAISRYNFDPSKPFLLPEYDQDGPFSFTLRPGEIVRITSTDQQLQHLMDAVAGPDTGKNPDFQDTYNQQKAGLSSGEVMPPFSFNGQTQEDVMSMLAKAPTANSSFRIISTVDATQKYQDVYPGGGRHPIPAPAKINGMLTSVAEDWGLLQLQRQPWS